MRHLGPARKTRAGAIPATKPRACVGPKPRACVGPKPRACVGPKPRACVGPGASAPMCGPAASRLQIAQCGLARFAGCRRCTRRLVFALTT